jgi:hypothetical protein
MKWRHRINLTSVSPASNFDNASDHCPGDYHNNDAYVLGSGLEGGLLKVAIQ